MEVRKSIKDFILPKDLEVLKGDAAEEYPDYLGQCNSLDTNLGRLIEQLKETGVYENTIILYVSDHGSHFNTRNNDSHLHGFDDYKRSPHDASLKVPLIIGGGKIKKAQVVKELVSTESLAKTILSIAQINPDEELIGENLLDLEYLTNDNRANEVYAQISESRVGRCIRTQRYLYSVYAPGMNGGEKPSSDLYADDYLYDMDKDPHQLNNLIFEPQYVKIKNELREKLKKMD